MKIEVMELLKGALRSKKNKENKIKKTENRKNISFCVITTKAKKIKWYIIFTYSQWRHVTLYTKKNRVGTK